MEEFIGKVAVVTGAATGIGRETAKEFAAQGASVVVADLHAEGGTETVNLIEEAGGSATFVQVNVADEASVEAMVKTTVATYGRLDILVNNAGITAATAAGPLSICRALTVSEDRRGIPRIRRASMQCVA